MLLSIYKGSMLIYASYIVFECCEYSIMTNWSDEVFRLMSCGYGPSQSSVFLLNEQL